MGKNVGTDVSRALRGPWDKDHSSVYGADKASDIVEEAPGHTPE